MLTLCDHASFICHGNYCGSCGCTIFPTMCLREAILHEDGNGSYCRNVDLLNVNWHAGAFTTAIGHMKAKGCIVCILERTIDTKHMSPVLSIAIEIARGVNYMVLRSICKRARDLVLKTCLYLHGTTTIYLHGRGRPCLPLNTLEISRKSRTESSRGGPHRPLAVQNGLIQNISCSRIVPDVAWSR